MRELTQTSLDPGNCWQTCVACILDVDPDEMPPQVEYDIPVRDESGKIIDRKGGMYQTALNAYLREHHGLGYTQLYAPRELYDSVLAVRADSHLSGYHMLTGRTVRSETNGGLRHVVVARNGAMVWDPHPSRAGLLDDVQLAFLVPWPSFWTRIANEPCACPRCKATAAA